MLPRDNRDALTQAEFRLRQQTMDRVEQVCRGSWVGLGRWHDPDVERWLQIALPAVQSGMQTIANAANVRLSMSIEMPAPAVIDLTELRGIPLEVAYWRPAIRMRWMLSQGRAFSDALESSANRVSVLVKTDLQLAYTHQCRAVLEAASRA